MSRKQLENFLELDTGTNSEPPLLVLRSVQTKVTKKRQSANGKWLLVTWLNATRNKPKSAKEQRKRRNVLKKKAEEGTAH
jgi:hypothetical protein